MQRNPFDLAVGHSVVLEWKFAIRKHKLGVILLGPLDPPRRVDQHHIEFTHLLRKQLPIEVADIAVDERTANCPLECVFSFVEHLKCLEILLAMVAEVLVYKWEFKGWHSLGIVLFVVVVVVFLLFALFLVGALKFMLGGQILNLRYFRVLASNLWLDNICRELIKAQVIWFRNLFMLKLVFGFNLLGLRIAF